MRDEFFLDHKLMRLTFRTLVIGLMFGLAGCYKSIPSPTVNAHDSEWMALVPTAQVDLQYLPYELDNPTGEPAGTVVVDTPNRFLYLVEGKGKAIRYGVAVGDEAFKWSGVAEVGAKKEWPGWLPPADMIARWPHLKPVVDAGGLKGGPDNPLGARALYLFQDKKDTLYRIHGTNEPETIGHAVSSGCIRMRNIDAIDLYERVPLGARVVVK
jgi:lipoprotein-anchoring transpeptidase ErfK/SrfK